jgi:prepilin-type N-terminal cleavage/methylation domain-containing protein
MKKAFSIVELMIVVAVLGIMAAIIVPQVRSHAMEAKEAVAKDNLRMLRGAIELYAAQHGGVAPGYTDDDPDTAPSGANFYRQTVADGRYMHSMPENPFNKLDTMQVIANGGTFPAEPTGAHGWIYRPATQTIRLDWPGAGDDGIAYYEY